MGDYAEPDKSAWASDDPRQLLKAFDEESFRQQYNEWMPREQPPLDDPGAALSIIDKMVYEAIRSENAELLLEVGCGNGRLAVSLLKSGVVGNAVLIDISDEMVKNAQQTASMNGVEPTIVRSSLEFFSSEAKYDVVLAQEVVEHFYNVRARLMDIQAMLKEGGLFIGTVPRLNTCDAVVHLHYFTRESLDKLLSEYFQEVMVSEIDATGECQVHLLFLARRKAN